MLIRVEQILSVMPDRVHVITRLVDANTGQILDQFAGTYHDEDIDDVVSASLAAARAIGRQLGGVRFLYETKLV
jgi:pyruvoyl-dependent arginine decarboxylase (PvlArgDC)